MARWKTHSLLAALFVLGALAGLAPAETITWDGNGDPDSDGNWSTPENWDTDTVPGPEDVAYLPPAIARNRTVTIDQDAQVQELRLSQEPRSAGFTNGIIMNANLTVSLLNCVQKNTHEWGAFPFNVNGYTLTLQETNTASYEHGMPRISGAGTIIKNGAGIMHIIGGHAFSGTVIVNGGHIKPAWGNIASANLVVNDGGSISGTAFSGNIAKHLTIQGTGQDGVGAMYHTANGYYGASHPIVLAADTKMHVQGTYAQGWADWLCGLRLSGIISGPGGITKTGTDTFQIQGTSSEANTYEGDTIVEQGTLWVTRKLQNTQVRVRTGAALKGKPWMFVKTPILEGTATWDQDLPQGLWSGGLPDGSTMDNSGVWSEAANWFSGVPNDSAAKAFLGNVSSQGNDASTTRTVTVDIPVELDELTLEQTDGSYINKLLLGDDLAIRRYTLGTSGSYGRYCINVGGRNFTIKETTPGDWNRCLARVEGAGQVTKTGTGTVIMTDTSSFTGSYMVQEGTLLIGWANLGTAEKILVSNGGTFSIHASSGLPHLKLNGTGYNNLGALNITSNGMSTFANRVTLESDSVIYVTPTGNSAQELTFGPGCVADGPGRLIKKGNGILFVKGTSQWQGGTEIAAGKVQVHTALPGSVFIATAGRLNIESANCIPDTASIALEYGGRIDIADGLTETVKSFFVDGTPMNAGTWGNSSSSAAYWDDSIFASRTGVLNVLVYAIVDQFTVKDRTSGSTTWTDEAAISVTLTTGAEGDPDTAYMITTTTDAPEPGDPRWSSTPITTYTLPAPGLHTLYGWVRISSGIEKAAASIAYSTGTAAISNVAAERLVNGIRFSWTTDAAVAGFVSYGPTGAALDSVSAPTYGTTHSVDVLGLTAGAKYDYQVHANDIVAAVASAYAGPMVITWDGDGDANLGGSWNEPLNWDIDEVPTAVDIAVLPSASSTRTVTVDVPAEVAELRMDQDGSGATNNIRMYADLSVGMIRLMQKNINNRCTINVGGNELTVQSTYFQILDGESYQYALPKINGGGQFVKTGSGRTYANNCGNGFTGTITVNEGFFNVAWSTFGAAAVVINDGGTLEGVAFSGGQFASLTANGSGQGGIGAMYHNGNGYWTATCPITLASDTKIFVGPTYANNGLEIQSAVTGPGGFTKVGSGPMKLFKTNPGDNTYEGDTIVAEGLLHVTRKITNSQVTVKDGAKLIGYPWMFTKTPIVEPGGEWDQLVAPGMWIGNGDYNNSGDWSEAANWVGGVPTTTALLGSVDGIGSSGTTTRTVTVDQPATLDELQIEANVAGYLNELKLGADLDVRKISLLSARAWEGNRFHIDVNGHTLTIQESTTGDNALGRFYGAGQIVKEGTGTVTTTNTSPFTGTITINNGTWITQWDNLSTAQYVRVNMGGSFAINANSGYAPLKLNGTGYNNQGALYIMWNGYTTFGMPITLETDSVINVVPTWSSIGMTFGPACVVDGPGKLTKTGDETVYVKGTCAWEGGTEIAGGIFDLFVTLPGDVAVGATATLKLESTAMLDENATVSVATGGKIDIADGIDETVGCLYFDGEAQARGTWGATDSGAVHENDVFFTGSGILTVGPAVPLVTQFEVSDQTSGSKVFTNSATVDVALAVEVPEGLFLTDCVINQTGTAPETWPGDPTLPSIYTFAEGTAEGPVALYVWVKDSTDGVGSASTTITFGTATSLVVTNLSVVAGVEPGTAVATWDTSIPAEGAVKFRPLGAGLYATTYEGSVRTMSHSVTLVGIAEDTIYQMVVINNEIEGTPFFYPQTWPIEGDANLDCRVNILDLIFIRNRLNQDPATDDNWQADVNMDTRINILDLIYVRNRLNNACP